MLGSGDLCYIHEPATKLQSRPLDAGNFPEESTLENREFQATEITSFCSPLVWWDAWQYLRDLLTRNVTILEFLKGISTGLFNEIQRSRGRIEFQKRSWMNKIIIFSACDHNLVRGQAAEIDACDYGSDSRVNLSSASNSANIGSESNDKIFVELRDAAHPLPMRSNVR
jgi:hypothetical protein